MPIYRRGETWWVNITHRGERVRQSTGTTNEQEAQRIHDQVKADLWNRKRSGATLNDALVLWLKESERSVHEKNSVKQFLKLYHSRPLSEITGKDIVAALSEKNPAHANRIASNIRAAINIAVERGLLDTAPKISRRKIKKTRAMRWLTPTEWNLLRPHLPSHLKPAADFAISTGVRQANVFGLRWSQVDLRRRIAWVDGFDTKSGKSINVPLSDVALAALSAVQGQNPEYVFTYAGKPMKSPKRGWIDAVKKSGIPHVRWHDLRHTWASWHLQNGTTLAELKELGGWHSIEMVLVYAHLVPGFTNKVANNSAPPVVTDFVTRCA